MADVYSNAFLMIAASKSADSNGKLTCNEQDVQLCTYWPKQIGCKLYARRSVDHFFPASPEPPFVLLSRGWVWRERLLSPRFLHFGPQEMVLEYRSINMCECGYEQWPSEAVLKLKHDHDDHGENPNVFVDVIDCHVRSWSPEHPNGEVLFGYLLLQGHLQPATLDTSHAPTAKRRRILRWLYVELVRNPSN